MNRYALVIGVSEYQSSHLKKLPKAATDAEAVAKVLDTYGNFQQVERLPKRWNNETNDWEVAEKLITKTEIIKELKTLLWERAVNSEALIYFAGHGLRVFDDLGEPQGFLAVSDCEVQLKNNKVVKQENGIALDILNRLISNEKCRVSSLVMLLDCCYSGSLLENQEIRKTLTAFSLKTDYFLIAGCRSFEKARAFKGKANSIFTGALLKGLSVENANLDGTVNIELVLNTINNELKDSGQEPIFMGGWRSITLIQYPAKIAPVPRVISEKCPYQGLSYFTESTAPYFFGRKKVIEKLKQKLEEAPFVPVIGASGSGKSSVVRAGLIPWLKSEGNWQILEIFPSLNPLEKLKNRLKEGIFDPLLHNKPEELSQVYDLINDATESIDAVISKLPSSERFLLLVDQFEEVFTLCPEEKERSSFIKLLTQMAQIPASQLVIIITIRADFLEDCLKYESLTQLIEKQAVYMLPLTEEDLKEIIVKPAEIQGYSLGEGLQEFILRDVLEERECLPLLEFTLKELWQPATEQGHRLTVSQYLNLGQVSGALEQHAEEIYAEIGENFGEQGQKWVQQICLSLLRTGVDMKDTRQRKPKAELLALAGDRSEDQQAIAKVLGRLIDGRLLVAGEEGLKLGGAWVDLSHEALIDGWKRFAKWREEGRDLRRLLDQFKDARRLWDKNDKRKSYLLTGGTLELVREKWPQLQSYLDDENRRFYQQSDREDRYRKTLYARTGTSWEALRRDLEDNLFYLQGKFPGIATLNDYYMALAYTVRNRLLERWLATTSMTHFRKDVRLVCYLSSEFSIGPQLGNNIINLNLYKVRQVLEESGLEFKELLEQEEEPGLGNSGWGRSAACFLDSLATLQIPAIGYGIRYEFGMFDQEIRDGWQVEITDKWLEYGNPWEIAFPDLAVDVKFYGHTEGYTDDQGNYRVRWVPEYVVKGIPYDTPILGYKVNTANTLRLWKAEACESFDFNRFNVGDYYGAVNDKVGSENLTKALSPNEGFFANDEPIQAKELRLEQQYFFVSCSLQDMIRLHMVDGDSIETFAEKFTAQLNDTHPSIGVAELMRLLVDEHHLDWDKAWEITKKTFAYTNHTLLPEALEKWPLDIFGRLLPRHLEIIYEINQRFLDQVRIKYPGDGGKLSRLSIIDESGEKYVRMANLACVGSYAVNGVAALHSELVKTTILKDFYELWPEKFSNKTNGVTPRRWMVLSNPRLAQLITEKIGDNWIKHLDELKKLEAFVDDPAFRQKWREIKQAIKQDLAEYTRKRVGITVSPESLFDIQVKRIHEYKRQHLDVLHIITLYNRIKQNPNLDITPRTFFFGGKAAPGYFMAKLIIKLITSVGDVVNNDPDVRDRLKVVFLPDYNVTLGQRVYPAADLSEQISTAGKEASGTGNMKFSMNGALTIGTLDGANVEIREAVGAENFFLFGLKTEEVYELKAQGYNPWDYYNSNPELKAVIDLISSGFFSHGDSGLFQPLVDNLLYDDPYLLLADYQSYIESQEKVSQAYLDQDKWTRMSILNVARMGKFSSDRTIREYCQEIWGVEPVPIEMEELILSESVAKEYFPH